MVELTDLDPVFIADVRSSFSALDDDGLLALLSCLAASLEVGLTTLGARHVRRMAIVGPTGVGDLALAQHVLEKLWDVSEGFQPTADGAAFVRGISIENFKEKFMAARSEAPTYVNTLLDLAETCYLPPHVEPLPRRGNEDGPLGPQSLQSVPRRQKEALAPGPLSSHTPLAVIFVQGFSPSFSSAVLEQVSVQVSPRMLNTRGGLVF